MKYLISLVILALLGLSTGTAEAFQLITPAEANLPAAPTAQIGFRGLTRGPTVDQVSPPADAAAPAGPLTLDVSFEAHNGATVDLSTVKVTYLKQPAIDLTQRLKPYITPKGIEAANVDIPVGVHLLRVDVTDSEGRTTTTIMKIAVAAQ
jgi:hypothetical protein